MDDELLADDGQFKDDSLDDLDIDAEAALLGLSDEEIDELRSNNDDQELEYVDEDGNPVAIGENNADLYEVANIDSDKLSNPPDEDVLELDLDAELESFNQETAEIFRDESPAPTKPFKDRTKKENLISIVSRKEQEKPIPKRRETLYSPVEDKDDSNKSTVYSYHGHSQMEHRDTYNEGLEFDEESEDESIGDDHRERFKSERNIITLTPAKRRTDIPDTLESVISVEETAKVQAFLENEQKKKMRYKGNRGGRGKQPHFQRSNQNFCTPQNMHTPNQPQFSSPSTSVCPTSAPQPRKILINPHFRGVRLPIVEQAHAMIDPPPQTSISAPYEASSYPPPQYSHPESNSVNMGPPPIYTAPPSNAPYKPLDYLPPQQHMQQVPPPMWQPPDMTVPSYTNPPPVINYGDQMTQPPYSTYNQNYPSYQPPPMSPNVTYSQLPPPVHMQSQPFSQPPMNPVPASMPQPHHYPPPNSTPVRMQQMPTQCYQEPVSVSQPQINPQHATRANFPQNQQRFSRPPEKRTSNLKMKSLPPKQLRLDHPQRKTNVHVNSSNIREIPLVDTLPKVRTFSVNKVVPIVEDEDEKTKELRRKIEEQKLLREQILKRKEERRRQMAAQRLFELKQRQAEQNKNPTLASKNVNQNNQVKPAQVTKSSAKPSVKERIGVPINTGPTKKKIVVVRKKVQPGASTPNAPNSPAIVGQRLRLPVPTQKPNTQQGLKLNSNSTSLINKSQQATKTKIVLASKPSAESSQTAMTTITPTTTTASKSSSPAKKVALKPQTHKNKHPNTGAQAIQRPPFSPVLRMQRPRTPGPRQPFPPSPPFMGHRMPYSNHRTPMNEMRIQHPNFPDSRPPLLRFHPPGDPPGPFFPPDRFFPPDMPFEHDGPPFHFHGPGPQHLRGPGPQHLRGPPPQHFRGPRGMEPAMYRDRFPRPPFPNQMRPMFDDVHFPRQRFFNQDKKRFNANNSNCNTKPANTTKAAKKVIPPVLSQSQNVDSKARDTSSENTDKRQPTPMVLPSMKNDNSENSEAQSVSVENLSSSTSEAQLKKLCSSVGVVETIQLIKSERKAVIKFKEPRQALSFYKKYQRYMLDLAMIQVSLLSA